MMTMVLDQNKVNELVDRFYDKLLKDSYYISMFKERNVDIELLKDRQRVFINRLVTEGNQSDQDKQASQVKERHPFQISPERAQIWFQTLKEAMYEMELDVTVKDKLIAKVDFLLNKIV
jgi:truncated hemoglobin YjbI